MVRSKCSTVSASRVSRVRSTRTSKERLTAAGSMTAFALRAVPCAVLRTLHTSAISIGIGTAVYVVLVNAF
ncbi:hypothetical protein [Nonomuraea polychroma]|uniref:hypothetical protein n=1 Tax=Nonomuraea polychroma TaxID=46176 RepID=UPI0013E2C599|nr:hypothetical protein [Nonomuraea polychroma]